MEAVSGEKVIFEKAAISDTDRGKEMNFFFYVFGEHQVAERG